MKPQGPQMRVSIVVGEADRSGHHNLATEIVLRSQQAGLAGASVFHGVEGFGASNAQGPFIIDDVQVVTYVGRMPEGGDA